MNLEDHERRIAELEKLVSFQVVIHKQVARAALVHREAILSAFEMLKDVRNETLFVYRLVADSVFPTDTPERQRFLDKIARYEQKMEGFEHLLDRLRREPPADPPAPGALPS